MLKQMKPGDRLRLMKFICSFAWADLEIRQEERNFVARMVARLDLDEDEAEQVQNWLAVPPSPDSVDPTLIPIEHRKIFLESIEGLIAADGEIAPEERENLRLLRQLA